MSGEYTLPKVRKDDEYKDLFSPYYVYSYLSYLKVPIKTNSLIILLEESQIVYDYFFFLLSLFFFFVYNGYK